MNRFLYESSFNEFSDESELNDYSDIFGSTDQMLKEANE